MSTGTPPPGLREDGVRTFGTVRLNRSNGQIWVRGENVKLPWRSAEALRMLADARGGVVTKEQFLEQIWGQSLMDDSNLSHCIRALRKSIDPAPNGESHIDTVARIGYRLAVEVVDEGPAVIPEKPIPSPARGFRRFALLLIPLALVAVAGAAALMRDSARQRQSEELIFNGLWELRHHNQPGAIRAAELFQRAEQLTPESRLLVAARAEFLARRGNVDFTAAIEMARRAAREAPDCTECQAIAGYVLMTRAWAWDEAGVHFSRVMAPKTIASTHRIWYAEWLMIQGRMEEALAQAKEVVRVMPHEPRAQVSLAAVSFFRGDYENSIAAAERAKSLNATYQPAHYWRWRSFAMLGADADAIVARNYSEAATVSLPETERIAADARMLKLHKEGGRQAVARTWLGEFNEGLTRDVHRYQRAVWQAWIGEYEGALTELEAAVKTRPHHIVYVAIDPAFAPLRANPRFQAVVRQVGLKPRS